MPGDSFYTVLINENTRIRNICNSFLESVPLLEKRNIENFILKKLFLVFFLLVNNTNN